MILILSSNKYFTLKRYFSNKKKDFMLQIDANQRPDIYQVAYLAFSLCKRDLTIKNRNVTHNLFYF